MAVAQDLWGKADHLSRAEESSDVSLRSFPVTMRSWEKWSQVLFVDTGQEERIQLSSWNRGSFGGEGEIQGQPQVGANFTFYFFNKITRHFLPHSHDPFFLTERLIYLLTSFASICLPVSTLRIYSSHLHSTFPFLPSIPTIFSPDWAFCHKLLLLAFPSTSKFVQDVNIERSAKYIPQSKSTAINKEKDWCGFREEEICKMGIFCDLKAKYGRNCHIQTRVTKWR